MKTRFCLPLLLFGFATLVGAQTVSNYHFIVTSQNPAVYYKLDGNLSDAMGGSPLTANGTGGSFMPDAYRSGTNSYGFLNSDDALIASDILAGGDPIGTNPAAAGKGTITMVFRSLDSLTVGGQRFVFSQGNTTSNGNALGLFFDNGTATTDPCALKLRVGDGTTSLLLSNAVAFDTWYYFAMSYDETRDAGEVIWYLGQVGGTLSSGTIDIGNDAVIGDNTSLYIGNQASLGSGLRSPGRGRVDEVAVWTNELSGTQISNQFAALPAALPSGPYQTLLSAENPSFYFKLDGTLVDAVGGTITAGTNGTSGAFTTDVFGNASGAYAFSETNDALLITNDIVSGGSGAANASASGVGTISLLFRMLSDTNNTGQRWIFSQGTNVTTAIRDALNVFLENTNPANGDPNSLKMRAGNTTTTLLTNVDIVPSAWYFFTMTFDETRNNDEVHWYLGRVGGALKSGIFNPANDATIGDNGIFYVGNRIGLNLGFRGPGQGAVDALATWSDELSPNEIAALFNALPSQGPPLSIAVSGSDALLSWPTSGSDGFHLENTDSLSPSAWVTNANAVTVIGTNNVVTNAINSVSRYFRLKKP